MKIRLIPVLMASSLMLGAAGVRATSETTVPKVISEAGISHVSGGVGEEEVQLITSMAKQFNLRLLMTTKQGNYLADVDVAIADRRGHKLLETTTEGPYLLAWLPPGEYQVTASIDGETKQQRVAVGRNGHREVRFTW